MNLYDFIDEFSDRIDSIIIEEGGVIDYSRSKESLDEVRAHWILNNDRLNKLANYHDVNLKNNR